MFEITIFTVEEMKLQDGTILYKLWFALDDGLAWIFSKTKYEKGQNARFKLTHITSADTKTNYKLTIKAL